MIFYRFKTFTTTYYFPPINKDRRYMYNLYSAYGGIISKTYWWLFRCFLLIRKLTAVKETQLDFPYQQIKKVEKNNSSMSFNMGSPGMEQKISMLGFDETSQNPFFAKFAQKKQAMLLSKNEISVLKQLQSTNLVPILYQSEITDNYVFLKTECIKGKRPSSTKMTEEVLDVLFSLAKYNLTTTVDNSDLKYSLSHGDFCPWNFIETADSKLRLIDWEMAVDKPLGYDLFTYIFQPAFLLQPEKTIEKIVEENKNWINLYFTTFEIADWRCYLADFTERKLTEETRKQNERLILTYQVLKNYLENLQ